MSVIHRRFQVELHVGLFVKFEASNRRASTEKSNALLARAFMPSGEIQNRCWSLFGLENKLLAGFSSISLSLSPSLLSLFACSLLFFFTSTLLFLFFLAFSACDSLVLEQMFAHSFSNRFAFSFHSFFSSIFVHFSSSLILRDCSVFFCAYSFGSISSSASK